MGRGCMTCDKFLRLAKPIGSNNSSSNNYNNTNKNSNSSGPTTMLRGKCMARLPSMAGKLFYMSGTTRLKGAQEKEYEKRGRERQGGNGAAAVKRTLKVEAQFTF